MSQDGKKVLCSRVESDKPVAQRDGTTVWIHPAGGLPPFPPATTPRQGPTLAPVAFIRDLRRLTRPDDIEAYGAKLGLSAKSLTRLGVVWWPEKRACVFPMYHPDGRVIGGRVRTLWGSKWAIEGTSNDGLFIPDGGLVPDQIEEVFIAEGPTDTAALLHLGLYAIGRASCSTGVESIASLVSGLNVVIVSDNDRKPQPDGTIRTPGQDGARALAHRIVKIARSVKLFLPRGGCKDIREWVRKGVSEQVIRTLLVGLPVVK